MNWCTRLGLATALGVVLSPSAAQAKDKQRDPEEIGNRDVGKGVNLYSLEKEVALGKQLAQELEREIKFVDAPVPAEFVNRLAQNLARNSDTKVPITAKVIDSPEVNAFALPGGFLYVNSGLILKAETEAELSASMAHEIAHVAARHGTRQMSRARILDIASLPLIFMGGWGGYAIRQGAGVAIPLGFLKFSRAFEEEADLLGLQYMYKAGYDPAAFIDFFEKLDAEEKRKPGTVSKLFASHPTVAKRIQFTQRNVQEFLKQQPQYVVSTSEFRDVQQYLQSSLNRRKTMPETSAPTLRRPRSGSTVRIEDPDATKPEEDERPTLKRRASDKLQE